MSTTYILLASSLYILTSYDLYNKHQYGMSLVFLAYTVANLGLIWATYEGQQ